MHAALHFSAKTADLRAFFRTAWKYDRRMPHTEFPVVILGAGRLAAAVRVQLRSSSGARASLHRDTFDGTAALFVACSDFENATLRASLTRRVTSDGAQILFASLAGRTLRVGPLISSQRLRDPLATYLTRSWDFSPMKNRWGSALVAPMTSFVASRVSVSPHVDIGVTQVAQIGASLVVGELAKILGTMSDLARDRDVAEIDPPLHEIQCADSRSRFPPGCPCIRETFSHRTLFSDTLSGRRDETFTVGGIECRLTTMGPARGWHPASLD
jgi:hypothetical protein